MEQSQGQKLQVLIDDPYLNDFEADIKLRIAKYNQYVLLTSSKDRFMCFKVAQRI